MTGVKVFRGALLVLFLIGAGLLVPAGLTQTKDEKVTVQGVAFAVPAGFSQLPSVNAEDVVFLFNQKNKDGIFVAVPKSNLDDAQVNRLVQITLSTYFPKEQKTYKWLDPTSFQKVSQFEAGNIRTQAYNNHHVIVFEFRRVVFGEREVIVGNVFEAATGKEAEEMTKRGGRSFSMSACNAEAQIIFSITGEKQDPNRMPCELTAVAPGS